MTFHNLHGDIVSSKVQDTKRSSKKTWIDVNWRRTLY